MSPVDRRSHRLARTSHAAARPDRPLATNCTAKASCGRTPAAIACRCRTSTAALRRTLAELRHHGLNQAVTT